MRLAGEKLERAIVGEHIADEAMHGALDGQVAAAPLRRHGAPSRMILRKVMQTFVDQRQAELVHVAEVAIEGGRNHAGLARHLAPS